METVAASRRQGTLRLRWLAAGTMAAALLSGCVPNKQTTIGQPPTAPAVLGCSAMPSSVFPGEPVTLTAIAENLDPKRHLSYIWQARDGRVIGSTQSVSVSTANMTPGVQTFAGSATDGRGGSASCRLTFAVRAFEPATITCTADPSTVHPGDPSTITCNAVSPQKRPLTYVFKADNRTLPAAGNMAKLDTGGALPGKIVVRATVTGDKGMTSTAETTVSVLAPMVAPTIPEPPPRPQIQNTGRKLLLSGDNEQSGYGLYSYLLWWSNPPAQDRTRYLRVISAFLTIQKASVVEGTEKAVDSQGRAVAPVETVKPQNLNLAYIPVTAQPPEQLTADWVLNNYDENRARLLLGRLPNNLHRGPYIVSVLHPLKTTLSSSDHFLFQNLSSPTITDDLAYAWVQQFQSQALQEAFWKPSMMTSFVLTMRDQVGALTVQIPDAKQGLATWIQWIAPGKH